MRKILVVGMILVAAGIVVIMGRGAADVTSTHEGLSLPASLDNLYPPKAQGPTYLVAMHDLNVPLAGLVCDLLEGDMDNAQLNLEKFKSQYVRVAGLVPEWESSYPQAPLNDLSAAMKSGDQGKVMGTLEQIDLVCHGCHVKHMPAVHFKYHWDDFKSISVTDPMTGELVGFKQFKLAINTDLAGIINDLEQGQVENARNHGQLLASRYEALSEVCVMCHDSEPKYFVSDDIRGMVDTLRFALDEARVNTEKVGELMRTIGNESCFKCHLVHVPAAYSKY